MKLALFSAILLLVCTGAHAYSSYSMEVVGDDVLANLTLYLSSEKPVNYWNLTWLMPESAELIGISDSQGTIEEYAHSNGTLNFVTNKGVLRKSEEVTIRFLIRGAVDHTYSPLKSIRLSLSGFEEEDTFVKVGFGSQKVLSGTYSFGFQSLFEDEYVALSGRGPVNLKVFFTAQNPTQKHYYSPQQYNLSYLDDLFWIIPSVTGFYPPFNYFSVVVLEDDEYKKVGDLWSAGTYRKGGLILMKNSTMHDPRNGSVILHETTHGFNEFALQWDETNISWFDEGTAKFVEFLVNRKLGVPTAEIFGKPTYFKRNNENFRIDPESTEEELWAYYLNKEDFMHTWNPEAVAHRSFGYAFAELFIREYVYDNGPDSLHQVYRTLRTLNKNRTVESNEERNEIIQRIMNRTLTPCYSPNRTLFSECLEGVHNFIPSLIKVEKNKSSTINFPDIVPKTKKPRTALEIPEHINSGPIPLLQGLVSGFISWLASLFDFLTP